MMICTVLLLLIFTTEIQCNSKPTFRNIGYLGRGYDILFGNPSNSFAGSDPGFRRQIFQLNTGSALTPDLRYRIPDGTEISMAEACVITFDSVEIKTSSDYRRTLTQHVSVSAKTSLFKASFSASKDYRRVENRTQSRSNVFVVTEGFCSEYEAAITQYAPPSISSNFQAAVETELPTTYDKAKLERFIQNFGTHVAVSLIMGARYGQISEIDTSAWTRYVGTNSTWKTSASASIKASFSIATMSNVEKEKSESFKRITNSQKLYSFGSRPPSDGSATTWAQTVFENPMPISYTLERISAFLTRDNFPSLPAAELSQKKAQIERYLEEWCTEMKRIGSLSSCDPTDPPKPDRELCRLCSSCAQSGEFSVEMGRKSNAFADPEKDSWDMYGEHCSGELTAKKDEWRFCCSTPECQLCKSCGGAYPRWGGNFHQDGKYYVKNEECSSGYNLYHGLFQLCCRDPNYVCRLCPTCGRDMQEIGRSHLPPKHTQDKRFNVLSEEKCSADAGYPWANQSPVVVDKTVVCCPAKKPQPERPDNAKSCRLCLSCARSGDYSIESGRKSNALADLARDSWDMYGPECTGGLSGRSDEWRLCCSPPEPQCQMCKSCGGRYPYWGGNFHKDGKYYVREDACGGGFSLYHGLFQLCCRTEFKVCKLCTDCGPGMAEVGESHLPPHHGESSRFNVLSGEQCTAGAPYATADRSSNNQHNAKFCCFN